MRSFGGFANKMTTLDVSDLFSCYYVIKTGDDYVEHVSLSPSFDGYDGPISTPSYGSVRDHALKFWSRADAIEIRDFLLWNTIGAPDFRVVKVRKRDE